MTNVPTRYCSICRIGDGTLVVATHVALASDGNEWFECAECAASPGGYPGESPRVALTPIEDWFRLRGLLQ